MGKDSILTATLRIYDEDVAEKFEEMQEKYKRLTRFEETSKSRTLNYIIGLAYQKFKELEEKEESVKESQTQALEFET